jgi:formylglycine-generating enzyme required for sulfatase activity
VLDEEMVALKTSNVRSEPSTRGQKISRIQAGRAISVLGKTTVAGSEWYQVVLEDGQTGYVFGSLLREQQIAVMMPPATLSTPKKKTTEPTAGTFMTPGKVFRDCADCPEMVVIPSGSFKMGLYEGDEDNQGNEGPVHKVTVSKEFAVGKYEVTQAQWQAVMGNNPSKFKGANSPVETVNWNDIKNFVRRLSAKTGKQYRLLSESEWEYAARASTTTKYHWGYTFSSSKANNGDSTKTVGSYAANSFGLHDLLGNVWEWVEDCDNFDYDDGPSTEAPRTTGDCSKRILRGGSHHSSPWSMRTTSRVAKTTDIRSDYFGFRIARTLSPQDAAAF